MPTIDIGTIAGLYRYPVKSMRGEAVETATLGWHGVEGDRRLGLRRLDDRGGFPWLTAGRLPVLTQFTPERQGVDADALPTHIRTPEGESLPLYGGELVADLARRHGTAIEMTHFKHGIFDDGTVSVITSDTVAEVCRLAERDADPRRFRPNVLVRSATGVPFEEDAWIGGVLTFGDGDDAPAIAVTLRDVRCAMVNIDPDGASLSPGVMKAVVKANDNVAGVYATVTRTGRLAVGQPIRLHR